jgi:hypothetical protein
MIARCSYRLLERLTVTQLPCGSIESVLELTALRVAMDHFVCCTWRKLAKGLVRNQTGDELRLLLELLHGVAVERAHVIISNTKASV